MILCVAPSLDDKKLYEVTTFRPGQVNRALQALRHASGKGANAARSIAAMKGKTTLLAFSGSGLRKLLDEQLAPLGVVLECIPTVTETRSCTTLVDNATGKATEIVEQASPVEKSEAEALYDKYGQLIGSAEAVVLAGSIPSGCPSDMYAEFCRQAREKSVPVVLDARRKDLNNALAGHPTVVCINSEELSASTGVAAADELSIEAGMQRLLQRGAEAVVVTRGKDPVRVISSDGETDARIQPPSVRAVNSVGSGDAMTAGIALGLAKRLKFLETIRLGIAMGSANAATLLPGDFQAASVHALLRSIERT